MTSRDFGYLTLRNTVAYRKDDTFVPDNYVFTVSSFGKGKWTNSLVLNDLQVSTLEARAIETSSIQISSLIDSDGTTGNPGDVLHTDGSTVYWAPVGAGTGFWTEDGDNIYNNNSGNVGINISTPYKQLHVSTTTKDGLDGVAVKSSNVDTILGAYAEGYLSGVNAGSLQVMSISSNISSPYTLALNPRGGVIHIGSTISNVDVLGPTYMHKSLTLQDNELNLFSNTIKFTKSYSTLSTHNGSELGYMSFYGTDQNNTSHRAGYIICKQDGQAGISSIPGRIEFWTTSTNQTDSNKRMTINSSGNVGIGTSIPTYLLEVAGNTFTSTISTLTIYDVTGSPGTNNQFLTAGPSGSSVVWSSITANYWSLNGNNIYNNNNGGSGYVGIGITTPQFPLDVNGVARIGNQTGNTSSFEINLGTTGVGGYRSAFIYSDGTNMRINNQQDGNLYLYTNNYPKLSILSTGNIGIGTSTPTYLLEVAGNTFTSTISTLKIYDVLGQSGTNNQVLTAGPSGNSVIWSTLSGSLPNGTCVSDYLSWNGSQWIPGLSTTSSVNLGCNAGATGQEADSIAIGTAAGSTSQSTLAIAIGNQAGETSQDVFTIAIGSLAGNSSQSRGAIAIGPGAGYSSQDKFSIAIGSSAGENTQGPSSIAIGSVAGSADQGANSIAIGTLAGNSHQGSNSIAIGKLAGETYQSSNTIVLNATGSAVNTFSTNSLYIAPIRQDITNSTLFYNPTTFEITYSTLTGGSLPTGTCVSDYLSWNGSQWSTSGSDVHIGCDSGIAQGASSIAIGNFAGNSNQADHSIAIGIGAGALGQSTNAIAIGESAGLTSQGLSTIAIGFGAGSFNQSTNAVSFGTLAGNYSQGESSIAIGTLAAYNSQQAESIAIGTKAAMSTQGIYSIAIGHFAGYQLQKDNTIAIGYNAAGENQSSFAIAIGRNAGAQNQGENAIAIGHQAGGSVGFQGENSIAIGYVAGRINQSSNTIVLNATGSAVDTLSTNALYIAPIRQNDTTSTLYYDPTTFEVSYGTSFQRIAASYSSTQIQTAATAGTLINFDTAILSSTDIVWYGNPVYRFLFNKTGFYSITLTINYETANGTPSNLGIWLKLNGNPLANTTWTSGYPSTAAFNNTKTVHWTINITAYDFLSFIISSSELSGGGGNTVTTYRFLSTSGGSLFDYPPDGYSASVTIIKIA